MKFNFGTGIAIFLILFVSAMIGFVIFTSRLDVNMVHEDYYERGVDHSQQIVLERRSVEFAGMVHIGQESGQIVVLLDEPLATEATDIRLHFYRPSDSNLDKIFLLEPIDGKVLIDRSELSEGRYTAKFSWRMAEQEYEVEKMIVIAAN